MEKLKVLYDAEILENSLTHNTSRTGIFLYPTILLNTCYLIIELLYPYIADTR